MNNSEEHRLACEVETWKRLIKLHGRDWWGATKKRIAAKRGEAGLKYLIDAMNSGAKK